jgi:hypothetical protein
MKYGAALLGPLALILIGALLLINNLQFGLDLGWLLYQWWPLAIIGLGLTQMLRALTQGRALAGGMILILIGTGFQIHKLRPEFTVGEMFRTYWPLVLVVIGISQLIRMAPQWGRGRAQ